MSTVDQIHNAVLLWSNPTWEEDISVPATTVRNVSSLTPGLAYEEVIDYNITTVSSKYASAENGVIQGFLYVPSLQATDSCYEWSQTNIPLNVTHRQDLPPTDLRRIAIAPWVSIECTQEYLSAARHEGIRAMIFYRPGNTDNKPRPGNDIIWALDDSFLWKEQNHFPVYAISSLAGNRFIQKLSEYSGAVEDVPNGDVIAAEYQTNEGDYVRIWTEIAVSAESSIPKVWVFVLIILGIIVGVIIIISAIMHAIQAYRRKSLRDRVRAGKVDLEALGITRIRVPRWEVQSWPVYTFSPLDSSDSAQPPPSPRSSVFSAATGLSRAEEKARYPTEGQYMCVPCGKHFVKDRSQVKEFPCGHIFEPKCAAYYTSFSSLCPLCKACLLPKGWSPKITNAMVKKELLIRPLQQDLEASNFDDERDTRPQRPALAVSRASSVVSCGSSSTIPLQQIQGSSRSPRSAARPSPRALWSRSSSRRTPPLSHLPTVSETEAQFPHLPSSPSPSHTPAAQTPTLAVSRPPSQPSPPIPSSSPLSRTQDGDLAIAVVPPSHPSWTHPEPIHHVHAGAELEHVRSSPSSSTKRCHFAANFVVPDIDEVERQNQNRVMRAFRKIFPGI